MDSSPRVSTACETCRKRKRKCDGLRPACSSCLARNTPCEYNTEKRIKRRVDLNYVRTLEDQIAALKEQLARGQPQPQITVKETVLTPVDHRGERAGGDDDDAVAIIPPSMSTAIEDVSALIWRMSIDNNGDASFIGPSGNFCFPVVHWDDADLGHESRTTRVTAASAISAIPGPSSVQQQQQPMMSDQVDWHLIDLFARFINPIQQFVDPETLHILRGDNLSPGLRLIKTAVLAAGALFADDARSKALGGEAAAVVDATALQLCRQSPDISIIQALSIMSWRELSLEQHNMAWMYNSMCASLVLHLGLPASITPDIGAGSPELGHFPQDTRRLRALWSSVFLDRIATSLLGRNCLLPWKRIKAPSFLSAVGPSPSLDELAFDHQCRLWFIHDQYMDNIYSFNFSELSSADRSLVLLDARDKLHSFSQNIHPSLQVTTTKHPPPSAIYLHISYHTSYILVHRPYLANAAQSTPPIHRLAFRSVSTAARAIVRLLRIHAKIHCSFTEIPPFIVHSVLTAAVTHLCNTTNTTHSTLRSQATAHFRVCFRALLAMQERWVKAKRAVRLLQGLARRWRVMGALPLQHGFEMDRGGDEQDEIDDEMELEGVDADADADADGDEPRMSDIIFPEAFFNFDTADAQQWEFLTESAPFNQI
ncbi:C6 transcription factor [Aspergillus costaricaensis CBS 115574]|uniref:C6 transcription factor n=1 Tax=Aspergillus costaricaensis CBS 115574 TaxID=1448317 RepID=A0ACD1IQG0_9EURO|nr:C6 transcription factor [Aspergillus costaricaensis CBS 115574]RAK92863.1 C6 transcription factor [Aspergillus costaricaensis CBS 115574]